MKNLKKLVSVVLALTMIISSMAFVSAKDFGDVDTTASYAEAVSVLADLSILNGDEEGNFNPDADIKRSEFAAVLCHALGQENAANGSKGVVVFDDVAADHWASGYIAWAAQQKIVNGKGDGKFDPDAPVKYDEAIKMIVVALGYEPMAAKKGGYPTGYMVVAGNNGITDGVKLAGGANAPRAIVAQLVYKALDVPLMDASYVSTKDEDYTIYDGEIASPRRTILSYYLDITKVKAEVLATAKTNSALAKKDGNDLVTLTLTNNYGFDWAKIFDGLYDRGDSDEFYVGASDIADYMAMSVVAYIGVNEDDNYEVVACVGDAKSVNILEVTEGIEVATYTPADPTASPAVAEGFTFEYFENEDDYRTTEVDIDPTATVYVNGKAVADTEFDNIITEGASKVVFMGAKGGNYDYDKVFITEYDFAVVDEVNVEDEYIKLVTGGSVDLSKEVRGDKFAYTLTFDGAEIALEDLQAGDLLNILCGGDWKMDETQVDIIVTRDAVEGIVEEEVKAGETYVINGEEYDISAKNDSLVLEVNDAARYFLTIDGKLYAEDADYEAEGAAASVYGFVTKVGTETSFGDTVYQVRMFTTEGAFVTYDLAEKIVVKNDGVKQDGEGAADVYAELAAAIADVPVDGSTYANDEAAKVAAEAKIASRLVTFKLNTAGEIKEIDLISADATGGTYNPTTEKFIGKYFTAKSALIMAPVSMTGTIDHDDNIGTPAVNGYNVDEDDLAVGSFAALDEDTTYAKSSIFDVNRKNEIGVAIVSDDVATSAANALAVVTKKSTITDGLIKLEIFQAGETASYVVAEDCADFNDVEVGDVIQFNLGGEEIVKGYIVYDLDGDVIATNLNSGLPTTVAPGTKYIFNTANVVDVKSRYAVVDFDAIEDPDVDDVDVSFSNEQGTVALWNLDRSSSQLSKLSDLSSLKVSSRYTQNFIVYRANEDGDIIDAIQYIAQ